MTRHSVLGIAAWTALSVSLLGVSACNREPGSGSTPQETTTTAAADRAADQQQDHAADVARLNERVTEVEKKYAEANQEVTSGSRTATAGLREEVKEDVTNVKEAVRDLGSTTPENWWDRHEQAMARTADDIEADVRRLAGTAAAATRPAGTTGSTNANNAPFESRRDTFVASLKARVDAMEKALDNVKASGPRETELTDTRARIAKLEDDLDKLRAASADDWWDVSKARVTEYVERVEDSVGRLDNNKPAR